MFFLKGSNVGTAWENRHRYRAYSVDDTDRIINVVEIEAESDEDAIAKANALPFVKTVELWDLSRRIARFKPSQDPKTDAAR